MTQREAFETWAKSLSLDTDHKEKDAWGREQYSPHIHSMWQGWQAAVEPVNEWKEAVLDTVAAYAMDFPVGTEPLVIVNQLIGMAVTMAKDPAINKAVEPVAYLAWRDGKPCYEGDDAVCEDAVWPVDYDDDRTSMAVYLASPPDHTAAMRLALEALVENHYCNSTKIAVEKYYYAIAALEKELK